MPDSDTTAQILGSPSRAGNLIPAFATPQCQIPSWRRSSSTLQEFRTGLALRGYLSIPHLSRENSSDVVFVVYGKMGCPLLSFTNAIDVTSSSKITGVPGR